MAQVPTTKTDVQVAVVGFGPSGAYAASALGHQGISVLAIDRVAEIYPKPRAIAIDHEILRLFDNIGLAEAVLPYVVPFPASEHFGADGQLIRRIDMVPPPYPMGYTPSMVFTQPPVEAAMRAHAAHYPKVKIELGTDCVGLTQLDDHVALDVVDAQGTKRTITADYVIACDGASSTIRQQLGITLDDLVFDEPWLVVDVQVKDEARHKLPQTAAQFCNPARPTSFLMGPGNHRRWEIMLLPDEDRKAMEAPDKVWHLLAPWLTPDDGTLWRAASYRFHALVAHTWRKGRVYLAGDAAHQQPPFIGQGMCQGLRDVSNLTWKLGSVLKGDADASLLDTYEDERSAHVRELTARIKHIGEYICIRDPDAARARDARILAEGGGTARTITRQEIVPPLTTGLFAQETPAAGTLFPQPTFVTNTGTVLMDKLVGAGWRVVTTDAVMDLNTTSACTHIPIVQTGSPQGYVEQDGIVAAWFANHKVRAAILRPDNYVYGTAHSQPELDALMADLTKRLRNPQALSSISR